jgi:hypothetical protein
MSAKNIGGSLPANASVAGRQAPKFCGGKGNYFLLGRKTRSLDWGASLEKKQRYAFLLYFYIVANYNKR